MIEEVLKLLGLILALILATRFTAEGAVFLRNYFNAGPEILGVMSFILIFILIMISVRLLILLLKNIVKFAMLSGVDRSGGFLFGAFKGALLLSVVIWALLFLPTSRYMETLDSESKSYTTIRKVAPSVYNFLLRGVEGVNSFLDEVEAMVPSSKFPPVSGDRQAWNSLKSLSDSLGISVDDLKKLHPAEIRNRLDELGITGEEREEILHQLKEAMGNDASLQSVRSR